MQMGPASCRPSVSPRSGLIHPFFHLLNPSFIFLHTSILHPPSWFCPGQASSTPSFIYSPPRSYPSTHPFFIHHHGFAQVSPHPPLLSFTHPLVHIPPHIHSSSTIMVLPRSALIHPSVISSFHYSPLSFILPHIHSLIHHHHHIKAVGVHMYCDAVRGQDGDIRPGLLVNEDGRGWTIVASEASAGIAEEADASTQQLCRLATCVTT